MDEDLQLDEAPLVLGHWNAELGHVVTFADLLAATPFYEEDRPPAGTECHQCRMFGHWCPAKGYCGEYALCLACGAGVACEQLAAVDRMQQSHMEISEAELFVPDGFSATSEGRTIEIAEEDRIVVERPLETAWTAKASLDPANLLRRRVAPRGESKKRIAKVKVARVVVARAPVVKVEVQKVEESDMELEAAKLEVVRLYGTMSAEQIAKQVGHSPYKVRMWLREAGLDTTRLPGKKAPGGKPAKKLKPAGKPKASAVAVLSPAADAVEMVSVRVPASVLDKLIRMLPAKLKASAIEKLLGELA